MDASINEFGANRYCEKIALEIHSRHPYRDTVCIMKVTPNSEHTFWETKDIRSCNDSIPRCDGLQGRRP
jgi:hypothetical protein